MSKYIPVIGLEVHCELKSNSKSFSTGKNGNGDVNTNLSVVDIGYPGILPCVNKEAVKKSIMVALALKNLFLIEKIITILIYLKDIRLHSLRILLVLMVML